MLWPPCKTFMHNTCTGARSLIKRFLFHIQIDGSYKHHLLQQQCDWIEKWKTVWSHKSQARPLNVQRKLFKETARLTKWTLAAACEESELALTRYCFHMLSWGTNAFRSSIFEYLLLSSTNDSICSTAMTKEPIKCSNESIVQKIKITFRSLHCYTSINQV